MNGGKEESRKGYKGEEWNERRKGGEEEMI